MKKLMNISEHVHLKCEMRIVSTHSVVIHKEEFVKKGYHTNSIESIWSRFKNWINSMQGLRNSTYNDTINEFMYRSLYYIRRNSEPFLSDLRNYQNLWWIESWNRSFMICEMSKNVKLWNRFFIIWKNIKTLHVFKNVPLWNI